MIHTQHTIIKDFFALQQDATRIYFGLICDGLFGIAAVQIDLNPGSDTFTAIEAYRILDRMMELAERFPNHWAIPWSNTETEKGITA